jgi:hypothetical protein
MRKWLALPVAVGIVVIPLVAFASGSATSPLSNQELAWDTSQISTSSTSWASIPALGGLVGGCNVDGISVAVTLNVTGKPFEVRATDGSNILEPSYATFRPPGSSTVETFSATFVGGTETNNTPLTTQVQWRLLASGGSATLQGGSVVVLPGGSHCG